MERDKIGHRITRFRCENGLLFRLWLDGIRRIVPRLDQRASLVRQIHEKFGHFGIRRTHSIMHGQYWWTGMYQQVAAYVGRCEFCYRVRSSFNTLSSQLQPLHIMGLGYHWSLDFAGPLVVTPRGTEYVLVMVEHFNKWIELVAAKVLTDQRREFLGAFDEFCIKVLIDHRTTSWNHLEADGLAERVVQSTKRGLRKYGLLWGATGIGTLCCFGLLWAINLVNIPLWRPTTCISCCMDMSLYFRVLFGKN